MFYFVVLSKKIMYLKGREGREEKSLDISDLNWDQMGKFLREACVVSWISSLGPTSLVEVGNANIFLNEWISLKQHCSFKENHDADQFLRARFPSCISYECLCIS